MEIVEEQGSELGIPSHKLHPTLSEDRHTVGTRKVNVATRLEKAFCTHGFALKQPKKRIARFVYGKRGL